MKLPVLHEIAYDATELALRRHAQERTALYPQYDGYYDDWSLHIVTEDVAFKGSSSFRAGEIVLASPRLDIRAGEPVTRTAYCPDTGSNCAVPHEFIRQLPSSLEQKLQEMADDMLRRIL